MRFYNRQHRHYCGIDLHVKTMYVCILDAARCWSIAISRRRRRRSSRSSPRIVTISWWPPNVCSPGTGWPTCARTKESRTSSATLWRWRPSTVARRRTTSSTRSRSPRSSAVGSCRRCTSIPRRAIDAGLAAATPPSRPQARAVACAHSEHPGAVQPPRLRAPTRDPANCDGVDGPLSDPAFEKLSRSTSRCSSATTRSSPISS